MSGITDRITDVQSARDFLIKNKPGTQVFSGVEYGDLFVFDAVPSGYDVEKNGPWLGGLTAVRKNDGKIFGFNPLHHDPESYFKAVKTAMVDFREVTSMPDNELMHYGVKGMKWGVRKKSYSSKSSGSKSNSSKSSGTSSRKKKNSSKSTGLGRKAVNSLVAKRQARKARKAAEEAAKKAKRKPVSEMTDEELNAKIKRLQLEKQYKELVAYNNPSRGKGKKFVSTVLEKSGEQLATQVANHYGAKILNKAIGEEVIFANNKKK